jgi:hypothetical protein
MCNSKDSESRADIERKAESNSPFRYWKIASHISSMAVVFEFFVTIVYWGALYDGSGDFNTFAAHILPCVLLTIDFSINRIHLDFMQFVPNLLIFLTYCMVNLISTKVNGYPVYSIMTFDSPLAYIIGFAMPPAFMLFWTITFFINKCKFAKCGE